MNHVVISAIMAIAAGIACFFSFLCAPDGNNDAQKRFLRVMAWNSLCACLAFAIWPIAAIEEGFPIVSAEMYDINYIDNKDGVITQYIKVDGDLINVNRLFGATINKDAKIRVTKSGKYSLGMYFITSDVRYWAIKDGKVLIDEERRKEQKYNDE